jgi:hypothetical protein
MPHFSAAEFAFTVWTLTRQLPKGILSADSRTERDPQKWAPVLRLIAL